MSAKVSNDFSPPIRKDSCRLSSCVIVCLHCVIANRHSVLSCRRVPTRLIIASYCCAWQRLSQHSLLACAARRKRLVSLNARKSCDSWLKTFWLARIPSPFVTAFRSLQVRPKTEDPTTQTVKITFCVSGVISPLLANLFLHYALDRWLAGHYSQVPFERYADDVIAHCRTEKEAQEMRKAIAERLQSCGLELHPEKTKIVYCKDDFRKKTYPNEKFDFLGYSFQPRRSKNRKGKFFINFSPAVSNKAAKAIRDTFRSWNLPKRSDKAIEDLSRMFNPIIRGWLQYYGRYYRSALYPTMRDLDRDLVLWAKRKYKKLRRHLRRATHWIARISRRAPQLFAHWQMGVLRGPRGAIPGATHRVITCKSAAEARSVVDAAHRILKQLGVELHPQKTRIVHVQHGFEFLGYKIKRGERKLSLPERQIRSQARQGALYAYPKEKSIRRFMDQVRQRTKRRVPLQTKELIEELNPLLRGWGEYFKRAHVRLLFNRLDRWIVHRIWSHRFKHWRNAGWKRLPQKLLYGEFELVNLVGIIPSIASRKQ